MTGDGGWTIDGEGVAEFIGDMKELRRALTDAETKAASMLRTSGRNAGGDGGVVDIQMERLATDLESASQGREILVDHLLDTLRTNTLSYLEIDESSAEELRAVRRAI